MADNGYLIGYQDANGNFVEVGRFDIEANSVSTPLVFKHTDSGEELTIDGGGTEVATLTVTSDLVDAAGISHTGEIADLTDVRSDEEIEDVVDALVATTGNISATYDDANDTLTFSIDAPTQSEFDTHSSRHENGGADELNVGGLSGDLADAQDPKAHSTTHSAGNADAVTVENLATSGSDGQVPTSQGDGTLAMESVSTSTEIDLLYVSSGNSLPSPSNISDPTIAYYEDEDDYVGIFKS